MQVLSIDQITVRQQGEILLEDLSFQVQQGEHWALLGNSTAATALLDTIAGATTVARGSISMPFLNHEHAGPLPGYDYGKVALVSFRHHFEAFATTDYYYQQRFNSMDVEQSITVQDFLHHRLEAVPGGCWTIHRLVPLLQLEPLLQKRIVMLSNGETKRLLLAAALLRNPKLLLLDQPFTGLDAETRSAWDHMLQYIAGTGIQLIIATTKNQVPSVITHAALFEKQKIQWSLPFHQLPPERQSAAQPSFPKEAVLSLLAPLERSFQVLVGMKQVGVRYGERVILEDINWTILPGERWALLGPNGSGKSTLLSLINGDNPQAFANNIVLFDRPKGSGESIWDIKRKIGFVAPDLVACFPAGNTCGEVVESGLYDTMGLFRTSDAANRERCEQWLQLLQLEAFTGKPFFRVPLAVQRQFLLARALVKNPLLLILDEPFQGLEEAPQLKELVDTICLHTGMSLVFVSHYDEEIPACVNKVLRLEGGREVKSQK